MSEVQCLRIRLAPGRTEEVADFLRNLRHRSDEVQEALQAEGIMEEALFLDRAADGDFLVFFTRARDLAAAAAAFQSSRLPLDVETRRLIADTWKEVRALELLVDLEG